MMSENIKTRLKKIEQRHQPDRISRIELWQTGTDAPFAVMILPTVKRGRT